MIGTVIETEAKDRKGGAIERKVDLAVENVQNGGGVPGRGIIIDEGKLPILRF